MKWLDKKISELIDKRIKSYEVMFDDLEGKVRELKSDLVSLGIRIDAFKLIYEKEFGDFKLSHKKESDDFKTVYKIDNAEISSNFLKLDADIHNLREKVDIDVRKNGFRVDEKDRLLRNDMELCFTGLVKNIDKKLELLGDKKGIVTDLLKRIAYLEGQVSPSEGEVR